MESVGVQHQKPLRVAVDLATDIEKDSNDGSGGLGQELTGDGLVQGSLTELSDDVNGCSPAGSWYNNKL